MFMLNAQLHKNVEKRENTKCLEIISLNKKLLLLSTNIIQVDKIYHVSSSNVILNIGWWIIWK